jgi:amino acid adenylation domain-containing protein
MAERSRTESEQRMRNDDATDGPSAPIDPSGTLPTVAAWLQRGAQIDPEAPAVQDPDHCLSYRELDELTDGVAADLRRHGVVPGDRVGLCIDRSVALVAGLVGIVKAGAAYVPLDPTYPRDRLEIMQQDAALTLTLVAERHHDWIASTGAKTRVWEELFEALDDDHEVIDVDIDPESAVFIVFTSGSTGRPKGVEMPHRAIANLIDWQLARRSFRPRARTLQYSSISFDVSLQEISTTLGSGGLLLMVPNEERRDARQLLRLLEELKIERLFLPFVALRGLVEVAQRGGGLPESVTEIITAGEQLRVDDALREVFAARPDVSLDNQYGPSETHVITAHLLDGDPWKWPDLPPIGTAISNGEVLLLDEDGQPVAEGDVGELYLGGRSLAHGYIGRPDLTAERFVTLAGDHGEQRYYRSGDLGRFDDRGEIHFQGRADHQVKIRGHRVEPGEINAVASRMPGVTQCLSHTFHKASGAPFIVTYYVTADAEWNDSEERLAVTPAELRRHLREHLPSYMVPAFVVRLDRIDLGPSGKANLQTLPDPRHSSVQEPPVHSTDTERKLAAIWSDVLEFPNLPPDADFFDLGGDSLAAVTLFLRIAEEFDVELPLATISQAPTLRALAARIDGRGSLTDGYRSLQVLQEGEPGVPPLVLVHGGGGNVLIFSELAANLGPSQPVYAFQWSGWDGHRGEATVADMADAYVSELRRFAPDGPYRLGGHCIGGLIAIEMAHRLVELGAEIDGPLIVSDAPNLAARSHQAEDPDSDGATEQRFEAMVEALLARVPPELRTDGWRGPTRTTRGAGAASTPPRLDPIRATLHKYPWMLRAAKSTRTKLQVARIELTVHLGRELPMDRRLLYCTETMTRTAKRHRPRPWTGDVLYFRTATFAAKEMALEGWWDDIEMGFGELCAGRFESHVVGGRHNEPLKLPWVAQRISEALDSKPAGTAAEHQSDRV